MSPLPEDMVLKVVSEIHDPVTTTDELIPSGETSSYRSNPLGLAEFTLSRKDPAYVGRAKEIQKAQKAVEDGKCPLDVVSELKPVMEAIGQSFPDKDFSGGKPGAIGFGSTIFAVKPGDGSAREQAASCQKVLGGFANICYEYATKRYRSNCINWGIVPFTMDAGTAFSCEEGDWIYIPGVKKAIADGVEDITAKVIRKDGSLYDLPLKCAGLTADERLILQEGCLMNYYAAGYGKG